MPKVRRSSLGQGDPSSLFAWGGGMRDEWEVAGVDSRCRQSGSLAGGKQWGQPVGATWPWSRGHQGSCPCSTNWVTLGRWVSLFKRVGWDKEESSPMGR